MIWPISFWVMGQNVKGHWPFANDVYAIPQIDRLIIGVPEMITSTHYIITVCGFYRSQKVKLYIIYIIQVIRPRIWGITRYNRFKFKSLRKVNDLSDFDPLNSKTKHNRQGKLCTLWILAQKTNTLVLISDQSDQLDISNFGP